MNVAAEKRSATAPTFVGRWPDAIAGTLIAVATFATSYAGARAIDPAAFESREFDVYLQGDLPRTYEQFVSRFNEGGRTGLHLLYPLIVHPVTSVLHALPGVSWLDAVHGTVALLAMTWALALFLCARAFGVCVLDAVLLTAVGVAGASARFWLVVPETFLPGGAAILVAVAVAARSERRQLGDAWYVLPGVATLGTTLTNFSAGALLALTSGGIGRAVRIGLQVFGATTLLWIGERVFFPNVQFIFDRNGVRQYVSAPDLARAADVTRAFFSHAAVAPRLEVCRNASVLPPFLLSIQGAGVGSGGFTGVAGTIVWFAMLGLGLYALATLAGWRRARFVLAGAVAFQFALHAVYGGETFLYSIHWWGLLVIIAGLALQTRLHRIVQVLLVIFICLAGFHNWQTWRGSLPAVRNDMTSYPYNGRRCAA